MAHTIFNQRDRQDLLDRLSRLKPDSERQFGKMTPAQMICHLKDSLELAQGKITAKSKNNRVMQNPLMRWLLIYVLPWPKGKAQTSPELLATKPAEWNSDLGNLKSQLVAVADRGAGGSWPEHPAFGVISGRDYGALIFKHFNHHLTQFGV